MLFVCDRVSFLWSAAMPWSLYYLISPPLCNSTLNVSPPPPYPPVRHLLSIPLAIGRFNTGSQSGSYFELFSKEGKLHKETSLFVSGFTLSFIFSLSEVNGSSGGKKITKAVYFRKSPNPSD